MQVEIRRKENAFWAKRKELIQQDIAESLASEGTKPTQNQDS